MPGCIHEERREERSNRASVPNFITGPLLFRGRSWNKFTFIAPRDEARAFHSITSDILLFIHGVCKATQLNLYRQEVNFNALSNKRKPHLRTQCRWRGESCGFRVKLISLPNWIRKRRGKIHN